MHNVICLIESVNKQPVNVHPSLWVRQKIKNNYNWSYILNYTHDKQHNHMYASTVYV